MRQFWRTVAGKMLLFLSCGVCGILFAATILGSICMVETDFYTREEKAIREEVFNGLLSREGRSLTWKLENDSLSEEEAQGSTGNLTWQIVGTDGKVKAGVKDSKEKWQYTEYYEVYDDSYNAIKREKQIKGSSRNKKIELIEKDNNNWDDLYDKLFV